ncbi:MAG: hypothetical protein V3U80_06745 [Flavobacteriaceae bacterium]
MKNTIKNIYKLSLFSFITILLFINCENESINSFQDLSNVEIGSLKNGNAIITMDNERLLEEYNDFSIQQGLKTIYTHINIQPIEGLNEVKYYALFAYNFDETVRSVTLLDLHNNMFKIHFDNGGSITCTTTDCSNNSGCTPFQDTNEAGISYWTCSTCLTGKCKKTTSVKL